MYSLLEPRCTAKNTDWDCCGTKADYDYYDDFYGRAMGSTNYKCNENEGDCDTNSDCADGLFCGTNNCPEGFPEGFDCCTTDPFSGYSDAGKNR